MATPDLSQNNDFHIYSRIINVLLFLGYIKILNFQCTNLLHNQALHSLNSIITLVFSSASVYYF